MVPAPRLESNTDILLVAAPICFMCVLLTPINKSLAILPAIMVVAFPLADRLQVAFIAFAVVAIFSFVAKLAGQKGK